MRLFLQVVCGPEAWEIWAGLKCLLPQTRWKEIDFCRCSGMFTVCSSLVTFTGSFITRFIGGMVHLVHNQARFTKLDNCGLQHCNQAGFAE